MSNSDGSGVAGAFAPGTMLDHYRLGKCLGVGGMGEVYYAVHEVLQTPCAIKIIRPEIAKGSSDVAERLIREARMACSIQHDNIVGVLDASSTSNLGCPYIVMEYVDGSSVEKYLESGPMPEADVIAVALGVTEALIAAAKYKIVHRDIKPANIMINSRGMVKLADLGIAKSDASIAGGTLTKENALLGTPDYAAPEQLRSSHTVDARADIYSLGATMYHLLSGHKPFDGDTVYNVIAKVICETPPTFKELGAEVSPALTELVTKMMDKEPENRPASAAELKVMLQRVARGRGPWDSGSSRLSKPLRTGLFIFAGVAAVALLGIGVFRSGRTPDKGKEPVNKVAAAPQPAPETPKPAPEPVSKPAPEPVSKPAPAPKPAPAASVVPVAPKPAPPAPAPAPKPAAAPKPPPPDGFSGAVQLPGGVKLEMVRIKAGSFIMGSPLNELGRYNMEKQHRVTLTCDYFLGKYEVTQGQWKAVMGNNPSRFKKGDAYPVENVSWFDAKRFCRKLNELYAGKLPQGYRFDLPTEAQWEYACRAGTTSALYSGKEVTAEDGACPNVDEVAWYQKNQKSGTHPVGQKRPNAWGLYDMYGNVIEWCRDWSAFYEGDAVDSLGPATGEMRVRRGGGWASGAKYCSSARRGGKVPGYSGKGLANEDGTLGFRLALVPIQPSDPGDVPLPEPPPPPKPEVLPPVEFAGPVRLPGGVRLEMVRIKAGSFIMGSPENEPGRTHLETQYRVTLTRDYFLGKYEVTQEQWQAVVGNNPSGFRKGGSFPVECVSWNDAKKFCEKLNELYKGKLPQGYCFDLPTEAQWEYACRAGTTTALNNGKNLTGADIPCRNLNEVAWYAGNSKNPGRKGKPSPHKVGGKRPNAWGLYDMHGNVDEWCRDGMGAYEGERTDPLGLPSSRMRVRRGGSWSDPPRKNRSARRFHGTPDLREKKLGFRLALVPIQIPPGEKR